MSRPKLSLLINISIDSDHDYLYSHSYYSNSLELYNKNTILSARRKVASQLNTYKKNATNRRRNLGTDSIDVLTSMFDNTLLTTREKTITTKISSLSMKLLIP